MNRLISEQYLHKSSSFIYITQYLLFMLLDLQDLENGMYVINNVQYVSICLITRNVILSCYTIQQYVSILGDKSSSFRSYEPQIQLCGKTPDQKYRLIIRILACLLNCPPGQHLFPSASPREITVFKGLFSSQPVNRYIIYTLFSCSQRIALATYR